MDMNVSLDSLYTNQYISRLFSKSVIAEKFQIKEPKESNIKKVDDVSDGAVLGIACIKDSNGKQSYGMAARYADGSTSKNPVVQVSLRKSGNDVEYYDIDINSINPSNATELEMFALCSYADDQKIGTNGTFGTWQTLKYYNENAITNGNVVDTNTVEAFDSVKKDWVGMCSQMMKEYFNAGIFKQYKDGMSLMNTFSEFC